MLPGRSAGCLVSSPYSVVVGSPAFWIRHPSGLRAIAFLVFVGVGGGFLGRFGRRFVCGAAFRFWAVSVGRFALSRRFSRGLSRFPFVSEKQ